jgi:Family of unknown function (DUF6328)
VSTEPRSRRPLRTVDHRVGDGRDETEAERIDRNLGELLQELRVATMGVQVLFGFLLALPFTTKFGELDRTQQALYTTDLVLAAVATALLASPVAHHRLLFRRHAKASILRDASVAAIAGLATVGLAISGSVLLVVSFVDGGAVTVLASGGVAAVIFGLWFLLPLLQRSRDDY